MFKLVACTAGSVDTPALYSEHRTEKSAIVHGRTLYGVVKLFRKNKLTKTVIQVQIRDKLNNVVYRFGSI